MGDPMAGAVAVEVFCSAMRAGEMPRVAANGALDGKAFPAADDGA
jgi:hypothetical protein